MPYVPLHVRVAKYLLEHCRGPGPAGGVPPFRVREALGASDEQVAAAVDELARRGVARSDYGSGTGPFSDPPLTNIYLTQHGWESQAGGVLYE